MTHAGSDRFKYGWLTLTLTLTLSLVSSAAFLALALIEYYAHDLPQAVDSLVATMIGPLRTVGLIEVFLTITTLGNTLSIVLVALASAFFLRKSPHVVERLAFVLIGSTLVVNIVKIAISRVRPETLIWFDPLLTYSFPSGHAAASMALYGSLAIISARLLRGWKRTLAVILCVLIILGVGTSRVVLSAHFFTDVIGGYLLGIAFVALAFSFRSR